VAPFVESRYSTAPFKVFAGHSFGGLFALSTFLEEPDAFDAYLAVSPSTQWDDELILRRSKEVLSAADRPPKTLYLSLGDEPIIEPSWERFVAFLEETRPAGLAWASQRFMDEDHGSVVLRSHYFGLERIFDGWRFPNDQAATAASVSRHYEALSKRLGWEIAPPEDFVNRAGYAHLQGGRSEDAIALFELNLSRYPDSPNVHDSYGEALEKSGDLAGAEAGYRRAVELAARSNDRNLAVYQANLDRVSAQLGAASE